MCWLVAQDVGGDKLAVVVGPGMDAVRKEAVAAAPGADVFVQENQLGTADAVLAARNAIAAHKGDLLVLFADTPLITGETDQSSARRTRSWRVCCRARLRSA